MADLASEELRRPWSRSDRRIPRAIVRPLQEFLSTSTSSAALLFAAVVVALIWANVGDSYERFWAVTAKIQVGSTVIGKDLRFWVNDGLMTLFFLLVGVEIKRELTTGELRRFRAAVLPVIAAIGGMVVPGLLYLAVAGGSDAARGWGIPMATDIALALGVLAIAARHAPPSLKPLMLTLAIVDDIGAILVIAVFYTTGGSGAALFVALGLLALIVAFQRVHVRAPFVYIAVGTLTWYATYRAGIHPTIAGVMLGLLTPSEAFQRPAAVSAEAKRTADATVDEPEPPDADAPEWLRLAWLSKEAVSPLARVEHVMLPWSSFLIIPLFALANAGVDLTWSAVTDALSSAVAIGVFVGLAVGKPVGIWLASRLAVQVRAAELPAGVGWGDLLGMGAAAGVGFTVALFIAELAFSGSPGMLSQAKVGILAGSGVAGAAGYALLRVSPRRRPPTA